VAANGETWFDFAVMVGGFKSDSPQHAHLFRRELTLPSVHVMGRSDTIVPIGDSRELANQFREPLVLEHPGGHVVPAIRAVTEPLGHFFGDWARVAHG
jgi:predicted alpha/beta hydrolase family esterase